MSKAGDHYRAGVRLELRCRDVLVKLGYYVMRSAGSHGVGDLLAVPPVHRLPLLLVQCKTAGPRNPTAWNLLYEAGCAYGLRPTLAYWTPTRRAIQWAEIIGPHVAHSRDWPMVPFDPAAHLDPVHVP